MTHEEAMVQANTIVQRADLEPEDQVGVLLDIAAALEQAAQPVWSREEIAERLCNKTSEWSVTCLPWAALSHSQKEFYLVMADEVRMLQAIPKEA